MLKWLFRKQATPPTVNININDIFRRFDLYNRRFKPDPEEHFPVLDALGAFTLRSNLRYGPAHSFYADPKKALTFKAPSKLFDSDPEPEEHHILNSARISFTEEARSADRRAFAMVIRTGFSNPETYADALVFGIYGIYDRDGSMAVKKIMMPGKDSAHRLTQAASINLTPENIETALRYAGICAETLYRGEPFYPRTCLEKAMANQQETALKNSAPGPS